MKGRLAPVGGFQHGDEEVIYVWMPTSLVLNVRDMIRFTNDLMKGIKSGKYLYAVYKGEGNSKGGNAFHDMSWVRNTKNAK